MADDALRALERRAAAGDAGAWLELAAVHLRSGRAAQALEAAWAACDQGSSLRREVARLPLRGAPLSRKPAVAWQVALESIEAGESLLWASPLGVVVGGTLLLDPITGATRARLPGEALGWHDEVLLTRSSSPPWRLYALDGWSGDALFDVELPGPVIAWGGGHLALRTPEGVAVWGDDARRPPAERWSVKASRSQEVAAAFHGERVALEVGPEVSVHDLRGACLLRLPDLGLVDLDAQGLLCAAHLDGAHALPSVVAHDLDGARRWRLPDEAGRTLLRAGRNVTGVEAPSADLHVSRVAPEGQALFRVDRETGALRESVRLPALPGAIVDDVLFRTSVATDHVVAERWTGKRLWRWRLKGAPSAAEPLPLAALPGRVYVIAPHGQLVCLVEDRSARGRERIPPP